MKKQLSEHVQNVLEICSEVAYEYGYKIYLIGGVVRDLYLAKEIFDIDIIVEGNAIDFCHKLADKKLCRIVRVQEDLKTAKVLFDKSLEIDFASTRPEFYPQKGHLPVVSKLGCSLQEDVMRRDFTLNSLAVSLNKDDYGMLHDYVKGFDDLQNGVLRVLHDNSFIDDPSRIIRGLKFAARFDLHRDEHTKKLQEDYQNNLKHDNISWARIKSELKQTFSLNISKVFDMFLANEVYKAFKMQKTDIKGLEIKSMIDKQQQVNIWLVYLACVLFDKKLIDDFCFTRAEKKVFIDRDNLLESNLSMLNSNYEIYKFFEKKSIEAVIVYYLLSKRKEPLIYLENLMDIRVELTGEDLILMGVKEGREIGRILDELLRKKLSGILVNKADEERFVKKQIK